MPAVLIYDPLTTKADGSRTPFAGNVIPPSRLNPVAVNAFKYYPEPTGPGLGPGHVFNYVYPSRWVGSLNQWIGRADYVINSKNSFFFRYGQNPYQESAWSWVCDIEVMKKFSSSTPRFPVVFKPAIELTAT